MKHIIIFQLVEFSLIDLLTNITFENTSSNIICVFLWADVKIVNYAIKVKSLLIRFVEHVIEFLQ